MPGYNFKEKRVAMRLRDLAFERMYQSGELRGGHAIPLRDNAIQQNRAFMVILQEEIPAATLNAQNEWIIHSGTAYLFLREFEDGEPNSQDPDEYVNNQTPPLIPWRDDNGTHITKRVWNYLPLAASTGFPFMTLQDVHGDLYIPGVLSNDHFVGKVPASGIPARVGLVPGTAVCEVWFRDTSTGNLTNAGFTQTVYNIYPVAVPFDAAVPYFQMDLDPFGSWFNEAPQVASASAPLVPFINDSGETMPPCAVIAPVNTVTIGGIDHIVGRKPDTTFRRFQLINGQSAVANGAVSGGSWLGDLTGLVAIDPGSLSIIDSVFGWGPIPNSWRLHPAYFGFTVPGSTFYQIGGEYCVHAKQHEVNSLIGLRLKESLFFNSFAFADIWHHDHLRERRQTQFNSLKVFDGMKLLEGEKIDTYIRIDVVWNGDAWELANASCGPDQTGSGQQQQNFGRTVLNVSYPSPSVPSFPSF